MLADRESLLRWQRLIDVPPPDTLPARVADGLAAARGRTLLTAATATAAWLSRPDAGPPSSSPVDADRTGLPDRPHPPLPPVPARRPAAEGAAVADAVWRAYVGWLAGDAAAGRWLDAFVATLAPTALVFGLDDNPEPWWQNEMVVLHAVHSYALRRGDAATLDATLRCADFHLREIQPDHATNEPWAVHAYASHADGNVTAETLWHAAHIQHGGALGPVARHLACDAAAALAAFLRA